MPRARPDNPKSIPTTGGAVVVAAVPPLLPEGKAPRWCPGIRAQGSGLSAGCGSCPLPSVVLPMVAVLSAPEQGSRMPERTRPQKNEPAPPEKDVAELQDRDQTEADFLHDLDRATTNRADERLEEAEKPSRRD